VTIVLKSIIIFYNVIFIKSLILGTYLNIKCEGYNMIFLERLSCHKNIIGIPIAI